jgi:uncharacterized membrane protein
VSAAVDARLRTAGLVLAAAGGLIAAYLTWGHYAHGAPVCVGGGGGCERVQSSHYAELGGVPVAAIGLAGYVAILSALLVRRRTALLVGAFLVLVGLGFSAYLTYLQLFVIDAVCQWCVASDVVMTALATAVLWRALR